MLSAIYGMIMLRLLGDDSDGAQICTFWQGAPVTTMGLNQQRILNFSAEEGMEANNLGQTLPYIKRFYTFVIGYCIQYYEATSMMF
jgi:hypothetical protein